MARDPYAVLGVDKKAADADIKDAYRRLVKSSHPDLHPGDQAAEERFKELTAAYDLLGDPDKRAKYDRGEIDAAGAERRPHADYRHYADTGGGRTYYSTGGAGDPDDMSDILSEMFRQRQAGARGGRGRVRMRGSDVRYNLTIAFLEAINGTKQRVTMPGGGALDISIPKGVRDGQVLRLKGKGLPGLGGGAQGDALIAVAVTPHPTFVRTGDDIQIELPVTLSEAINGSRVRVPTVSGPVHLTIPKHANSGNTLRLKGKGVPGKGDQLVTLKVVLPDAPDADLEDAVRRAEQTRPYDPRRAMGL